MAENQSISTIRHSLSHIMAEAVSHIFPDAKFGIGPSVEDGFYYDFELPRALTPDDLVAIQAKMRDILAKGEEFIRCELSIAEARHVFSKQPYKLEILDDIIREDPHANISMYRHGSFEDLCRGPHVDSVSTIDPNGFNLLKIAGAYWRGNEKRPQLQRIYGTGWSNAEELQSFIALKVEAERRDHRRIGEDLNLFGFEQDALGGGLVLWREKGGTIRHLIEEFWKKEHLKNHYSLVNTPHIGKSKLWETSGHLAFYRDSMYSPMEIDGEEYFLKPMNCPFHIMIYKSRLRSYRELPVRYAEMGTVYRYERSGVLHGLMRVRGFTQDDAHHFVTDEQMPKEIDFVLSFTVAMLRHFGFTEFNAYLSTMPKNGKAVGNLELWQSAEKALSEAITRAGINYKVDEGGGAFYGPKIDVKIKDAIGREWQLSTIQFDFNLPERFDIHYIAADGQRHRPYMIHRALFGSLERFFGILIENYAGAFPVWLAPTQCIIITVTEKQTEYAVRLDEKLSSAGFRVRVDSSMERLGNKIRIAQGEKIPFMLVVGEKEQNAGTVAVRDRKGKDHGVMSQDDLIAILNKEAVIP